MDPITVFLLGLGAGAVGNWLAKKIKKSKPQHKVEEKIIHKEQPLDLPEIEVKEYLSKWSNTFLEQLKRKEEPTRKTEEELPLESKQHLSRIIVGLLNTLDRPLFWLGILLAIWLCIDPFLQLFLTVKAIESYRLFFGPILAIASPAAVGYWTNYLAIKMLFHPRKNNRLWWGLIPARRKELVKLIANKINEKLISPDIIQDYLHRNETVKSFLKHLSNVSKSFLDNGDFRQDTKNLIYKIISDLANSPETQKKVSEFVKQQIDNFDKRPSKTWGDKVIAFSKNLWGPKVQQEIKKALPKIPIAMEDIFNQLNVDAFLNCIPFYNEKEGDKIEAKLTSLIIEGIKRLDFKNMVTKELSNMDEAEIEKMLTEDVVEELKFIMTSGGIFGILVGLAISVPWFRIILIAICGLSVLVYVFSVQKNVESMESEEGGVVEKVGL